MSYKVISFGESDEVSIVIPCSIDRVTHATKLAMIYQVRAFYPCKVNVVIDTHTVWRGWIKAHNWAIDNIECKYYLYSCSDFHPGMYFLKLAVEGLKITCKKLFAFNDGRWFGKHASVGLVDREYARSIYGTGLFYEGYVHGVGDNEISRIYKYRDEMCYYPEAILMEADIDKIHDWTYSDINDQKLYKERKKSGFGGLINYEIQSIT